MEIVQLLCQKKDELAFLAHVQQKFQATALFAKKHLDAIFSHLPLRPGFDVCTGELRKLFIDFYYSNPG